MKIIANIYGLILTIWTAIVESWITFVIFGSVMFNLAVWVLFDSGLPSFERGVIASICMALGFILYSGAFDAHRR